MTNLLGMWARFETLGTSNSALFAVTFFAVTVATGFTLMKLSNSQSN